MTYIDWKEACYATGKVANEEHSHIFGMSQDEELITITFTNGAVTHYSYSPRIRFFRPNIWRNDQKICDDENYSLDMESFRERLAIETS